MSRIFLMFIVFLAAFGLSACQRDSDVTAALPAEAEAVTKPFFAALQRGDQKVAEKYIAPVFTSTSRAQFAQMSALLKNSPPLASNIYQQGQESSYILFSAKQGKNWISAEVRLGRINGKNIIQYWEIKKEAEPPALLAHVQMMKSFVNYGKIALVAFAALFLVAIIWLLRRRKFAAHSPEFRTTATIVRNSD